MYERLTSRQTIKHADDTEHIETYCHGHKYGPAAFPSKYGTSNPQEYKNYCEMVDRLAAYEDTGLSPEEVQELANAKADGRLVVLPCKVGDTVWILTDGEVVECVLQDVLHYKAVNYNLEIGRKTDGMLFEKQSVFLTREAAEKALGGGEG